MTVPAEVECPDCSRLVRTVRGCFARHSIYATGPECERSRTRVTDEVVVQTRHRQRAEKVLLWASMLREEDPRRVHSWIRHASREELEILMVTALAAIPPNLTLNQAYGWVRGLA